MKVKDIMSKDVEYTTTCGEQIDLVFHSENVPNLVRNEWS